jgi:hypothetical protein
MLSRVRTREQMSTTSLNDEETQLCGQVALGGALAAANAFVQAHAFRHSLLPVRWRR